MAAGWCRSLTPTSTSDATSRSRSIWCWPPRASRPADPAWVAARTWCASPPTRRSIAAAIFSVRGAIHRARTIALPASAAAARGQRAARRPTVASRVNAAAARAYRAVLDRSASTGSAPAHRSPVPKAVAPDRPACPRAAKAPARAGRRVLPVSSATREFHATWACAAIARRAARTGAAPATHAFHAGCSPAAMAVLHAWRAIPSPLTVATYKVYAPAAQVWRAAPASTA